MTEAPAPWARRLRFAVGGALNTALSYGVYLALLQAMSYQWAYLFAYAAGVLFAYWFNATVVFKVALRWRGLFAYPLVYLIQYPLSALLLAGLVRAGLHQNVAPLLVPLAMMPVSYGLNALLLRRRAR